MATNTLPPDYFRTAAEKFAKNPADRKVWLQDQIAKAQKAFIVVAARSCAAGFDGNMARCPECAHVTCVSRIPVRKLRQCGERRGAINNA